MGYLTHNSALKIQEKEAERCSYPLRLDVYGSGCDHHCTYCYARAQMVVGGWNNSRNTKHPFPRVADKECLRKLLVKMPRTKPSCVSGSWGELRQLLQMRLPLRVGAVTDCFQRYMESRTGVGLELLRIHQKAASLLLVPSSPAPFLFERATAISAESEFLMDGLSP